MRYESNRSMVTPVNGSTDSMLSISSPQKITRIKISSYARNTSTVSPFTRKFPRLYSTVSLREYKLFTNSRKKWSRSNICPSRISIVVLLKSSGFPMPYRHETDETTITSLRPESNDEVAAKRSFSISSLMERSFSM
ncbi:MAG: hypothetical protein BWZ00_01859 [Bacteroidetes bacterium ADurb.BinA174]|nr:MAG: hypothetical protein BWZ00_01859 [Bacteroidetes bacterium ADurb.BinA174]